MSGNVRLKVCGLTSAEDADAALAAGADFLGLIAHPGSPRYLAPERLAALAAGLPAGRVVVVAVSPAAADLRAWREAGAAALQVHFPADTALATLRAWSEAAGADRLWLAPRLPPEAEVPEAWLPLAETFLLDTFDAGGFGGTGRTGDWAKFARHRRANPRKTWILSGGLNPANVRAALAASGADFVDVGSGVEARPGTKDPAKLRALAAALAAADWPGPARRT
jgi:phosphoribosylanthranilate isomerase